MTKRFVLKVPYNHETIREVAGILYEHFEECNGVSIRPIGGRLEVVVPNNTPLADALKKYEKELAS